MDIKLRYKFKKEEKLKSRKTIELLFKEGKSFSNFPFRVLFLYNSDKNEALQAGFAVSSKHFKRAVDRNRIKRLMRESYRLQKAELHLQLKLQQKQLAVFFIYIGNELPEYQLIFEKTGNVLNRLIKTIDENHLANS